VRSIDEHAQEVKEVGTLLDLVEDDETAELLQDMEWRREPLVVYRALEVEDRSTVTLQQQSSERRLTRLARP
jgi:hypothetical protein